MQARFASAVLLGFVLLAAAACSSSSDRATIEQLESDLEASEEALERETEARETAEEEADTAEEEAEEAKEEADTAEEEAEEAKEEAEEARQDAQEAEDDAAEAERLRQEEEAARLAAEAEAQRLAAAAETARKAADTERARVAISGTRTLGAAPVVPDGAIEYGEPAPVTTPPGPFSTSTSGSGRWSTTTHTALREATRHTIEIYSDVEAPARSAFRTSALNTDDVGPSGTNAVIDGTNMVRGWVEIMNADGGDDNHSRIAASGSFPQVIGNPVPFTLVDRGLTESAYNNLNLMDDGSAADADLESAGITRQQYDRYRAGTGFRNAPNTPHFPERYAYTTSGQLQGASGTFRCNAADTNVECTVQNRGGSFQFGPATGPATAWDFVPASGTVQIVVPDAQYMWFGWWARQTVEHDVAPDDEHPTDIWAFQAAHGGENGVSNLEAATGSATYSGPAAGRYAVYEPVTGDSAIGSFTASATLQADFDEDTVSGTITGFSNDSGWSLALKEGEVMTGTAPIGATVGNNGTTDDPGGVTWTIDGVPDDSGKWEGGFYSNIALPENRTITYQPHGIAGTFEAAYDPSGVGARAAVIGAFGAHR